MSNQFRPSDSGPRRPLRLGAELERMLPDLIRDIAEIPSNVLLSVTSVEVTQDLSLAQVYFSVFGTHANGSDICAHLNKLRGRFRTEIAQRIVMRQHPQIRFVYDETPANAARIEALLKEARGESES